MNRMLTNLAGLRALLSAMAVWLVAATQALAARPCRPSRQRAASSDYMLSYLVVILGIVLGLLVVAKASNRRDRERPADTSRRTSWPTSERRVQPPCIGRFSDSHAGRPPREEFWRLNGVAAAALLAKKAAIRSTTNFCSSARSSGKIGSASTSSAARRVCGRSSG